MTREQFVSKFKIGDRVMGKSWIKSWGSCDFARIVYIGQSYFLGVDLFGDEEAYQIGNDEWELYEEKKEEKRWAPVAFRNSDGGWLLSQFLCGSLEEAEEINKTFSCSHYFWPAKFDSEGFLIIPEDMK